MAYAHELIFGVALPKAVGVLGTIALEKKTPLAFEKAADGIRGIRILVMAMQLEAAVETEILIRLNNEEDRLRNLTDVLVT